MKRLLTTLILAAVGMGSALAVDDNSVEIAFDGTSATVTIADNIKSYITNNSSGSHVKLVQSDKVNETVGEILYYLSGTSGDGEFYLEGSYKASVILNALTLTNPSGPAINIQNGKRINISVKNETENSLTDGANGDWKGCFVCKGHTEFKGKGKPDRQRQERQRHLVEGVCGDQELHDQHPLGCEGRSELQPVLLDGERHAEHHQSRR